eukprot:1312963-Pleurochrysis_carterae.AAC.1
MSRAKRHRACCIAFYEQQPHLRVLLLIAAIVCLPAILCNVIGFDLLVNTNFAHPKLKIGPDPYPLIHTRNAWHNYNGADKSI